MSECWGGELGRILGVVATARRFEPGPGGHPGAEARRRQVVVDLREVVFFGVKQYGRCGDRHTVAVSACCRIHEGLGEAAPVRTFQTIECHRPRREPVTTVMTCADSAQCLSAIVTPR